MWPHFSVLLETPEILLNVTCSDVKYWQITQIFEEVMVDKRKQIYGEHLKVLFEMKLQ